MKLVRRRIEFAVFIAGLLAFGYFFSSCSKPENKVEVEQTAPAATNEAGNPMIPAIDPNADFSKFDHENPNHSRFPCALCHERKDNSAMPKLAGHMPCAGCHTEQFADNKNAICTICHTNAETGDVKKFPALKSFNAKFDHAKHAPLAGCATCHKPSSGGVAMSIPASFNAHNSCFECHAPEAKSGEKDIASCGTCHEPGNFGGRISERSRVYETTPFSHASHKLDCASCHAIKAGAARGNQVATAMVAKMHFAPKNAQSCATCHNNKRAFGGDDFQDCKRCHTGSGFKFPS